VVTIHKHSECGGGDVGRAAKVVLSMYSQSSISTYLTVLLVSVIIPKCRVYESVAHVMENVSISCIEGLQVATFIGAQWGIMHQDVAHATTNRSA